MSNLEENITQFIKTTDTQQQETIAQNLAQQLNDQKLELLLLVQALGKYLTDLEDVTRAKGTLLLSMIVGRLSASLLSTSSLLYLVGFFIDRLQDYPCHREVLLGLQNILSVHTLPESDAQDIVTKIFQSIFREISVQSLPQSDRMIFYKLIEWGINNHAQHIKIFGTDFVYGFIQGMEGEKDPRNLLIAFRLVKKIVSTIPEFIKFDEDLFEITSCYFPITFTAKPNDPASISKEQLVIALRESLCCHPALSQYCIPFLMQKLSESSSDTKIESLKALSTCCHASGWESLSPFLLDLWPALRVEITSGSDSSVIDAAYQALKDIVATLSKSNDFESLNKFIDPIILQFVSQTRSENDNILTTAKILRFASSASYKSCQLIFQKVIPVILDLCDKDQNKKTEQAKFNNLSILLDFTKSARSISSPLELDHPITPFFENIYSIFSSASFSSSLPTCRVLGISGICELLCIDHRIYDEKHVENSIHLISNRLLEDSDESVKDNAADGLCQLISLNIAVSSISSLIVRDRLLRLLPSKTDDGSASSSLIAALSYLVRFATSNESLFDLITDSLIQYLQSAPSMELENVILSRLHSIIASETIKKDKTKILYRLLVLLIQRSGQPNKDLYLHAVSKISSVVAIDLDTNGQTDLCETLYQIIQGDNSSISKHVPDYPKSLSPHPSDVVLIFASVLQTFSISTSIYLPMLYDWFETYSWDTLISNQDLIRDWDVNLFQVFCRAIGSIVNKNPGNDTVLKQFISKNVRGSLFSAVLSRSNSQSHRRRLLSLLAWIVRASVASGHEHALSLFEETQILFSSNDLDTSLKHHLAMLYSIFLKEDSCLPKRKPLYQQKYFTIHFPNLLNLYGSSSNSNKSVYLIAIVNLISSLPSEIIRREVDKILPLMLESLRLRYGANVENNEEKDINDIVIFESMKTVKLLISQVPDALGSYLQTLVPLALKLAMESNTVEVKLTSLECLIGMTRLPYRSLYPYIEPVLAGLLIVLDDKKRVVRRLAVKCRNEWFVLDKTS